MTDFSDVFIVEGRDRVETVVAQVHSSWNKKKRHCFKNSSSFFPPVE